ncbi:tetratricopeptide repeat protein, partial [Candidatus Sumerlaeota bacterium]|nr:tetratricopeptide repeat protein [Candidatus Sumerlaeota bacterium]
EEAKPKAIEAEFKRVLELEADQLSLAEKYALYLHNTGKNRKAAAEFLRIAKVYEDSLSDLEEAIRVIRLLRSLEPADLSVTEEEAALLEKLGRKDEAVAVLRDLALSYSNEGSAAKSADCVGHCAEILSDDHIAQIEAAEAYERLKQADKATQYFMRAIALHQSAGSLDANIPLLKRVIQLNPADLDIPEALARTFEQTGQPAAAVTQWLELGAEHEKRNEGSRAIEIYRHVKTIEAEELESRRRLARICAQTGDNAGALTELREIVPITLGLGDEDETISVLKRILELDAEDAPSMVILADQYRRLAWDKELFSLLLKLEDLYCRTDQTDSAISVLEELRSLRPDDLQLTRQSFDLLVKTRKNAEAASVGTSLVETFLQHDDAAKAKELMRLVDDIEPDNVERRISLAHLADSHGHSELALEEFRRGCEELAEYGAIEPALQLAEAGLKSFADDIGLRRAKISLLKQAEKADLAIEEMLSLASLYETQGEDEQSYKVLDEILADYPESIPTHQQIVNMALRSGDMERTSEHLIQLAEINYVAGNLTDSIRALEQLLELQPERTELRTRLAELHHEAGNTPRAREVWFHAAKELRAAKQLDQAIEIYQRVRENYPDDVDTLANLTACLREGGKDDAYLSHAMELSESYTQTGDFDRATHILEELGQRFPKNIAIWERLAAAHAESGDQDGAVRCFKAMFEIHQSQRRYDLAKACLEQAYQLRPDDVEILQQLGEICLRLNQRAEGLEHLSKAALRMKELSNFDEARQIIERIMKIDPTNLETRRILGSICEEMGDFDNAVKNYALAARGFSERRENVQAIQVFEHLLKLDPGLSEEREAYAHVLERENRIEESGQQYLLLIKNLKEDADPRQVIRYCRQILKENPYHVEAHIYLYKVYDQTKKPRLALEEAQWLADYYISTGDMDEAEAYIRRGLEASPGEIELRKRFVDILIETNRQGEAADNLRELASSAQAQGDVRTARWALSRACEVMPENLEYRQQLAQLLETAGELAEARRVRIEIMQIYLAQGEMEKARAMGERVVESAPNDEELRTHVAQIFENAELPEVAAFHYTYMAKAALQNEDHKRVLKITDHILKIKPRHIPARECLVQSLMASGDGAGAANHSRELYNLYLEAGDLEDAHRVLKIVIQNRPSDPEPRRLMVDLYRKMGKMDQVVEQLRRLAEICANNSDIDNAVAALKELIQIRPDDTRARARYIDLYSQMGDESELYDDFLQLARAYRKEGSVVEASQVYEKLLQTHPERTECREQFVDFLFEQ